MDPLTASWSGMPSQWHGLWTPVTQYNKEEVGAGARTTRFTATVTAPPPFLDRSRGSVVGDGKLHHCRLCTTPSGSTLPGTRSSPRWTSPTPTPKVRHLISLSPSLPLCHLCYPMLYITVKQITRRSTPRVLRFLTHTAWTKKQWVEERVVGRSHVESPMFGVGN
jgi:hypothetical protein